MDVSRLRTYLLSLPGAMEDHPFMPEIPVYKVQGKMFAYLSPGETPPRLTIKLEPLRGQLLRATYPSVRPGYHMNKDHWNTVFLDGSVPDDELLGWIDDSYELVVEGLPARLRKALRDEAEG
jgi:predicted DNA-binding protein (MmcQ/YjbR family)